MIATHRRSFHMTRIDGWGQRNMPILWAPEGERAPLASSLKCPQGYSSPTRKHHKRGAHSTSSWRTAASCVSQHMARHKAVLKQEQGEGKRTI